MDETCPHNTKSKPDSAYPMAILFPVVGATYRAILLLASTWNKEDIKVVFAQHAFSLVFSACRFRISFYLQVVNDFGLCSIGL